MWIGILGAIGLNVVLVGICVFLLSVQAPETSLFFAALLVGGVVSVAVPIVLAVTGRPRVARGVLTGDVVSVIVAPIVSFGLALMLAGMSAGPV